MENQKKVELISFELKDFRIIRAVKLDFDKWKDTNVLEVVGDIGNGKSSLLEGFEAATTGATHIKDKDLLELGFKSEVQLADGEHKLFLGIKMSEISRGENKGKPKFETYLYEKDVEGKMITSPVIDGKKTTAKDYTDMLSTALTFRMSNMFSENQKTHRELIQELFARELSELGVEELLESIAEKKKTRDDIRYDCERNSAFMEHFKSENHSEESLALLKTIPVDTIEAEIEALKVEKGMLLKNPEKAKEERLNAIKEEGRVVVGKIRKLNEKRQKEYDDWKVLESAYDADSEQKNMVATHISNYLIPDDVMIYFNNGLEKWNEIISSKHEAFVKSEEMEKPILVPIEDDAVVIYEDTVIPEAYKLLMKERSEVLKKYKAEKEKEIDLSQIDTKEIDAKLEQKDSELKVANHNNELVSRFQLWKSWIEAKGIYEKEVDTLRKLYTKIDTGVEGLVIVPDLSDTGKLSIWMEYNGEHDAALFKNPNKESRRLYEYSKSQRAITGVLLQAARLDKKDKALRLAVLDDYTQTKKGKALLEKICKERDLKLVIAKTSDEYKLDELSDGTFVIENGELLLN